jgi:hypothetical protein
VRTTVDIADDVLYAVKEKARREKRSAGEVLSELARQALVGGPNAGEVAEESSFYGFHPLPRRGPAVSNELIDRLREDEPD